MRIEKEYDVQELANKVKEKIGNCGKCETNRVGLDIITAQEIVDVLEVVASWENKGEKSTDTSDEKIKCYCFGRYLNGNMVCVTCKYKEQCKELTKHE